MATLEERVSALEVDQQELRHQIVSGLGAHSLGLQLVHADTQAIKTEVAELRAEVRSGFAEVRRDLNALGGRVDGMDQRMGRLESDVSDIKTTLGEVLRRLPEPSPDSV